MKRSAPNQLQPKKIQERKKSHWYICTATEAGDRGVKEQAGRRRRTHNELQQATTGLT